MKPAKRRVQAQRKFAQGAYIPPSAVTPTSSNSREPIVAAKEDHVSKTRMAPKSLLDMISFNGLHLHKNAVVLLERIIPDNSKIPSVNNNKETLPEPKTTKQDNQTPQLVERLQPPEKPHPQRSQHQRPQLSLRAHYAQRPHLLKERAQRSHLQRTHHSQSVHSQKVHPQRTLPPQKQLQKRKQKPINGQQQLSKKRKENKTLCFNGSPPTSDVTDTEDERPLTYLKKQQANRNHKSTPKRMVTRGSTLRPETRNKLDRASRSRSAAANQKLKKDNAIGKNSRITRSKSVGTRVSVNKSNKNADEEPVEAVAPTGDQESAAPSSFVQFKQPSIPTRFATDAKRTSIEKGTTGSDAVTTPSTSKGVTSSPMKDQHYYGRRGIHRWLQSSDEDSPMSTSIDEPFVLRYEDSSYAESGRNSPCPSESIQTVRDVMMASDEKLAGQCNNCVHCVRMKKVKDISRLLQLSNRQPFAKDVYEFDTEREASTVLPTSYINSRRNSKATEQDNQQQHLYLDILSNKENPHPHIIKIMSDKMPNASQTFKACLVPRSEANNMQDYSLAEHESLFDQLLKTLQISLSQECACVQNGEDVCTGECQEDQGQPTNGNEQARRSGKVTPAVDKVKPQKKKSNPKLVEAPTYLLTDEDILDPITFYEKIAPAAAKYGICKVIPPLNFKPVCILNDDMRFCVFNHYICRMYSRWGPAAREICAMKVYLANQNILFQRVPLLDSVEANLPKLYSLVQKYGGLEQVIEKKRWGRVAEDLRLNMGPNTEKNLDSYYVKNLLPYDAANNLERDSIKAAVESCWIRKNQKLLKWAINPLHTQKKIFGESDSSDDSDSEEPGIIEKVVDEAEDCVVSGRTMNFSGFKKVANTAKQMYQPNDSATTEQIEKEYWQLMLFGTDHICVNYACIDTGASNQGFSKNKSHQCGRNPWNLKMLANNSGNLLRSLGQVLGVSVPTLHLGMIYSTSCWHRDPHALPWMEYMHEGPPKIWYGIPDEQSNHFRKAVETLCPTSVQNKSIWLSSDISMIPPDILLQHDVSLSRVTQNPGEFVIVFPKAYSCSISTGFTVSESCYFAPNSWLKTIHQIFQELRDSCEPTMFSLEQLLIALATDTRSSLGVLQQVHSSLSTIIPDEISNRQQLVERGLQKIAMNAKHRNTRGVMQEECDICRSTLYLSKVTGMFSKNSLLCLKDALRVLLSSKHENKDVSNVQLAVYYTEKQLEDIVKNIQARLFP